MENTAPHIIVVVVFQGDVANEVETEQIVVDSSISSLTKCNATSFVQVSSRDQKSGRPKSGTSEYSRNSVTI